MKRILFGLAASAIAVFSANASLVFNNSFDYLDGSLVTVSEGSPLGVWKTHSGTAGQVDVVSGKVNLTQAESEDVSCALTNEVFTAPFSTGVLYASMTVNFSALPAGTGGYFWHFRDTGTGFRARIFASVLEAGAESYRVGIANGSGTPVYVPTDLVLGQDYKLVVKYNVDAAVATLWLNPTSEESTVNRIEGTDSTTKLNVYHVALRQSLASGNGMGTLILDDLLIGTEFADVANSGGAPSISGFSKQTIPANGTTGPLAFTVDDVETPVGALTVVAVSDNSTLVPNDPANLALGGADGTRSLTVTPAVGQEGSANITVTVTDGDALSASTSFQVIVGAPSISPIADQMTPVGVATSPIAFTVADAESLGSLVISKTSDNPGLVSDAKIVISGSGTERTITITPEPGQAGLAKITLTVSDGIQSASSSFNLTVYPSLGLQLGDDFEYPDGQIGPMSGSMWRTHSPAPPLGDALVASGKLALAYTNFDDVSAFFTNSVSFAANSGVILYSSFDVNFSVVPSGSGEYFAHFKDTGAMNYRGRIFAMTNGTAEAGKYRIGVANGGFTVAAVPQDLDLNTTYTVVSRYNVGTATTTVWVNPRSEDSAGASATDPINPVEIWQFAFRQNSGIGVSTVDNLKVGTAFSDVVTELPPLEPVPLVMAVEGNELVFTWNGAAFSLAEAESVTGPYNKITGAASGYRVQVGAGTKFYRLVYP